MINEQTNQKFVADLHKSNLSPRPNIKFIVITGEDGSDARVEAPN